MNNANTMGERTTMLDSSGFHDRIYCPYCFGGGMDRTFKHTEVCFRLKEIGFNSETDLAAVFFKKYGYKSETEFTRNYDGTDSSQILEEYKNAKKLIFGDDSQLKDWWTARGNLKRVTTGGYILDPTDPADREYILREQADDDGFIYNNPRTRDFVIGVKVQIKVGETILEERCCNRVCPFCHNPLPPHYGMYECKFLPIVGITNAGKTVYISRLLYNFPNICARVGLRALPTDRVQVREFIRENPVEPGKPLPGPSPKGRVIPPLFYDIHDDNRNRNMTLVIYDIAGENCTDDNIKERFREFVKHADGIIMLLSPKQFSVTTTDVMVDMEQTPEQVLISLENMADSNSSAGLWSLPMAGCISQADRSEVQRAIKDTARLMNMDPTPQLTEVTTVSDNGTPLNAFNSQEHAVSAKVVHQMISQQASALDLSMRNFKAYNFFWLSALNCGTKHGVTTVDGKEVECEYLDLPEGTVIPPAPLRIEEPLYWMFTQWNMLNPIGRMYNPKTRSTQKEPDPEPKGLFGKLFGRNKKGKQPESGQKGV